MIGVAEDVFQKYARVQVLIKVFWIGWGSSPMGKSGNDGIRPIVASACLSPLGGDFALPLL